MTARTMEQTASVTPQREVEERFKDKEYMNWQRAYQSLVMLKEFLDPFMDKKVKQLHEYILTRAGAQAIVACQGDHNIRKNDFNWWMPRGPVTSKATSQTQTEQTVDHLADFLKELQGEDEATAPSSPVAPPEPEQSTGEVAVDDNTPSTGQKG